MIVYHGSKSRFDLFNYDMVGKNGTSEGIGFYFTNNKSIAICYASGGYLYTIDFKGVKPLNYEKLTITAPQLKKYFLALNKKTDYLSNWGDVNYEGIEKVVNKAVKNQLTYNYNDVDLIASICHESGQVGTCLTTLYEVLGYDSIVMKAEWGNQKIHIALVNDIIKILRIEEIPVIGM